MAHLSPRQRAALEHLAREPWSSPWWGGKPHCGWPEWMGTQTYNSLIRAKMIQTVSGPVAFDAIVKITKKGREMLRPKE